MKKLTGLLLVIAMLTSYSFTAFSSTTFIDTKNHWAKDCISELAEKNIVSGVGGGKFMPEEMVTRAQFVSMTVRAIGLDIVQGDYSKDTPGHWADTYIDTAAANGILDAKKYGGKFLPEAPVLRGEMTEILCKALRLEPSSGKNPFADMTVNDGYTNKLYEERIVSGFVVNGKTYFKPNNMLTRAEATTVIVNLIHYKENPEKYKRDVQYKEDVKNFTRAEIDKDFEAFTTTDEAKKYMSTQFFRAENGVIIFKNGEGLDFGGKTEIIVPNTENKKINVNAYNVIKTLVASARKNGDYVRALYNPLSKYILISYYQNQLIGEKAVQDGMFTVKLPVEPYVREGDRNKNLIGWDVLVLWKNYNSSEEILGNNCKEQIYVDILTKAFKTVYGDTDGKALADYAIKQYDIYTLKSRQGVMNYENHQTVFINGFQVSNRTQLGKASFDTTLK